MNSKILFTSKPDVKQGKDFLIIKVIGDLAFYNVPMYFLVQSGPVKISDQFFGV